MQNIGASDVMNKAADDNKDEKFLMETVKGPLTAPAQYIDNSNIVTVCGMHFTFTSPATSRSEVFSPDVRGVSCSCTDQKGQFAVAEWCTDPLIYVFKYPFFQTVAVLEGGAEMEYLCLAISADGTYLAALSGIPDFTVFLWDMIDRSPVVSRLEIGYLTKPMLTFSRSANLRLALSSSNGLDIIEIDQIEQKTILTRRRAQMDRASLHCWDPYDNLLGVIANRILTVDDRTMRCTENPVHIEPLPKHQNIASVVVAHGNVLVAFDDGRVMMLERRLPRLDWAAKTVILIKIPTLSLLPSADGRFFVHTSLRYKISVLHLQSKTVTPVPGFEYALMSVIDGCIMEPANKHFVTVHKPHALFVWNLSGAHSILATLRMGHEVTCMAPAYDGARCYVGTVDSHFLVVDLFEPTAPRVVAIIRLSTCAIKSISVSPSGHMAAVLTTDNVVYFLSVLPSQGFAIKNRERADIDTIVQDVVSRQCDDCDIIAVLYEKTMTARCFIRMFIFNEDSTYRTVEYGLDTVYTHLSLHNNASSACLVALEDRSIRSFALDTFESLLSRCVSVRLRSVYDQTSSEHQMCVVGLETRATITITAGNDGYVIGRSHRSDSEGLEDVNLILKHVHQPHLRGIKLMRVSEHLHYCSIVGHDGTFAIVKLPYDDYSEKRHASQEVNEQRKTELAVIQRLPSLNEQTMEINQATWEEVLQKQALKKDEKRMLQMRDQVKSTIKELRKQVGKLIDENENMEEIDRLSLTEFELDTDEQARQETRLANRIRELRMETITQMATHIYVRNRLKQKYWDSMEVKGRSLHGFLVDIKVDNYPMAFPSEEISPILTGIYRRRELEIYEQNVCQQQMVKSQTNYETKQSHNETPKTAVDPANVDQSLSKEEQSSSECYAGSLSHTLGVHMNLGISQLNVVCRKQKVDLVYMLGDVVRKLKNSLNAKFGELFEFKTSEMARIAKYNDRLEHIYKELNMAGKKIWRPVWQEAEQPEACLIVEDSSIKVEKYLPPEEYKRLEKERRENEKQQKEKIRNSEFKERALIKMMDGVLETKWEDTLKIDIVRPAFIDSKHQEEWTSEERAHYDEYKQQCEALEKDRETYRKMLTREETKLVDSVQRLANNFDESLRKLFQQKIETDRAILQEELKIARYMRDVNLEDLRSTERDQIIAEIELAEQNHAVLKSSTSQMRMSIDSYRSQYNDYVLHYTSIDKSFKREFPNVPSQVVEQLYQMYKSRPAEFIAMVNDSKVLAVKAAHDFIEIPKGVTTKPAPKSLVHLKQHDMPSHKTKLVSKTADRSKPPHNVQQNNDRGESTYSQHRKSSLVGSDKRAVDLPVSRNATSPAQPKRLILPSKSLVMEMIEKMNVERDCPTGVDDNLWRFMCKLRHDSMLAEYESIVKAQMIENIGNAVEKRQKWESALNLRLQELSSTLNELKDLQMSTYQDPEVQLIMKLGHVEVELGDFCPDFSDAVLIARSRVEELNSQIRAAGQKKIDVMKDSIRYRQAIDKHSWEAEKSRMTIEDLQQRLKDITFIKLTRKFQQYLREGKDPSKAEILSLERRLEALEEVAERQEHEDDEMEQMLARLKRLKSAENQRLAIEAKQLNLDVSERELLYNVKYNRQKTAHVRKRLSNIRKLSLLCDTAKKQQSVIAQLSTEIERLHRSKYPAFP